MLSLSPSIPLFTVIVIFFSVFVVVSASIIPLLTVNFNLYVFPGTTLALISDVIWYGFSPQILSFNTIASSGAALSAVQLACHPVIEILAETLSTAVDLNFVCVITASFGS